MFKSLLMVFTVFAFVFSQETKEFQFEKMKLGMEVDEFTKLYPQAEYVPKSEENTKANVSQYMISDNKSASIIFSFFLDKSLYCVILIYNEEFVDNAGGEVNMYKALVNRLGRDANITDNSDNVNENKPLSLQVLRKAEWDYPAKDRYVSMVIMADESIVISYRISSKDQVIRDRLTAKTDLGF